MGNGGSCEVCEFWKVTNEAADKRYGICRRFPPTLANKRKVGSAFMPLNSFPSTHQDDLCGEYKRAKT
jgi:hypothetical protein